MKAASLKEIKTELNTYSPAKVFELCMTLAKYKKDNKELLSYLLFESMDERTYINDVKELIDEEFKSLNKSNLYLAKKTIRKVLKIANKHIKYSRSKQTEVELLIYFCKKVKKLKIPLIPNTALGNLYFNQVKKIVKTVATLHEDLQYDFSEEILQLNS